MSHGSGNRSAIARKLDLALDREQAHKAELEPVPQRRPRIGVVQTSGCCRPLQITSIHAVTSGARSAETQGGSAQAASQSRTIPDTKRACHANSASSASTSRSSGMYVPSTLSMPSTRPRTRSIEMASTSAAWRRMRSARSWATRKLTTTSLGVSAVRPAGRGRQPGVFGVTVARPVARARRAVDGAGSFALAGSLSTPLTGRLGDTSAALRHAEGWRDRLDRLGRARYPVR
jgi:hypothetical protein